MTVQRSLRGLMLIHIAMVFAVASAQEPPVIPESPTHMIQPTPTKPSSGKFGTIHLNNTTLKTR